MELRKLQGEETIVVVVEKAVKTEDACGSEVRVCLLVTSQQSVDDIFKGWDGSLGGLVECDCSNVPNVGALLHWESLLSFVRQLLVVRRG